MLMAQNITETYFLMAGLNMLVIGILASEFMKQEHKVLVQHP
jgi:hypothetical protein